MVRQAFGTVWRRAPQSLRKTIVAVFGGTIVLLGLALIVLPGPFTLPLLLLGFAILGTEFAWAARALQEVKVRMERGAQLGKAGLRRGAAISRGAAARMARRGKGQGKQEAGDDPETGGGVGAEAPPEPPPRDDPAPPVGPDEPFSAAP